ncbi:MAG: hypothetical protein ING29_10565 [Azospirillum sp.]|nr:hypothetical protein [Azospirillum sp.]
MIGALKAAFFKRLNRTQAILRDRRGLPARRAAEAAIAALPVQGPSLVDGTVLVDVAYQHPNYWLRYGLLSAALGLPAARQVALAGLYTRSALAGTLDIFGIRDRRPALVTPAAIEAYRGEARALIARAGDADGLFAMAMPLEMPAFDLYDGLLRTQRAATVDLRHPDCENYTAKWLAAVYESDRFVRELNPALAILSHAQSGNDYYGALAYALLRHGVEIVVPNGFFENLHFHRVRKKDELYRFFDAIEPEDIDALTPDRAAKLADTGCRAIEERIGGNTNEFAAIHAFGDGKTRWTREGIRDAFGWDDRRPIVALLTSTWFDYPHIYGNTRFRDFADWVHAVVAAAARSEEINLVIRGHPLDRWYNDLLIDEVVRGLGASNIGVLPYGIDGSSVMRSVDAMLTYYGSAAIEYAAQGKPVLIPDRGWYHRHAFVRCPDSRAEYLDLVGRATWWKDMDLARGARHAEILQAMRLGYPAWQDGWLIDDDNAPKDGIYAGIPSKLARHGEAVARELSTIRRWMLSDDMLYHRFKMLESDEYRHI